MKRYLPTACGQVAAILTDKVVVLPDWYARELLECTQRWAADFKGSSLGLAYSEWADDLASAITGEVGL